MLLFQRGEDSSAESAPSERLLLEEAEKAKLPAIFSPRGENLKDPVEGRKACIDSGSIKKSSERAAKASHWL